MKSRTALIALTLLMLGQSAIAREPEEQLAPVPFDAESVLLPAYPKPENLVRFDADASAYQIYVDATTITVGDDEVVRYVLVLKTAGGASNVSYEGLRCTARDRTTYAFGRNDGTWVR